MALGVESVPLTVPFNQTNSVFGGFINILKFGKDLTKNCVERGGAEQASIAFVDDRQSVHWIAKWPEEAAAATYPAWLLNEAIQKKEARIHHLGQYSGGIFPLLHHDRVFGLLCIQSGKTNYFQPGLVAWIQVFVETALKLLFYEKDRAERLQAAHSISRVLHTTTKLQEVLPELLDLLTVMTAADAATVLRFNPASNRLDLLAARGLAVSSQKKIYLHRDDGLAGQAAASREPLWVEDLQSLHPATWHVNYLVRDGFRGYLALPLVSNQALQGVIELFWQEPQLAEPLLLNELDQVGEVIAYSLEQTSIIDDLQRRNDELASTCNATIEGLSRALELRDLETQGHTRRVSELTMRLAAKMNIPPEQRENLRQGALLHDIGKLGIPDAILLKPGSLTPQEWKVMQQHPLYAYSILAPIINLRESLDIPLYHHERWDGSGYPYGLAGDQIPLSAQLFAVVDVYDALTSDRPYRTAWSRSQAIDYLREQAGIQFSPVVVNHFLELLEDLK